MEPISCFVAIKQKACMWHYNNDKINQQCKIELHDCTYCDTKVKPKILSYFSKEELVSDTHRTKNI